jgi:hypothetical protein
LAADNAFIVIALPDRSSLFLAEAVDFSGRKGLESSDDFGDWFTQGVLQNQDAVEMVGHNDEFINRQIPVVARQPLPVLPSNLPKLAFCHFSIYNIPKKMLPIGRANRNKIGTRTSVVVALEANRTAMMDLGTVFH